MKKSYLSFHAIIILIFYNVMWMVFIPFLFVFQVINLIIRKISLKRFMEKFSLNKTKLLLNKPTIIIHGVSAGESSLSSELAKEILKIDESYQIILTTHTESGHKLATKKTKNYNQISVSYIPYDFYPLIKRFVNKVSPKLLIILETEIWPSIITICHSNNIPIESVNARIYEKDFRTYKAFKFFFKPFVKLYEFFLAQSEEDKNRLITIGAEQSKVEHIGNMKFDVTTNTPNEKRIIKIREKVYDSRNKTYIMIPSTHRDEEKLLIKPIKNLMSIYDNIKIVFAPRNINRKAELIKIMQSENLSVDLFSTSKKFNSEVLIIDTFGDLMRIYPLVDIVIMGGTFLKSIGGHNLIEPATFGIPVWVGPYTYNFNDIITLLDKNKSIKIIENIDQQSIFNSLNDYFKNKSRYTEMGKKAKRLIAKNKGITKEIARRCLKIDDKT